MEEIFAIEREDESNNNSDVIELNQIRSLILSCLPQLTSFCSKVKTLERDRQSNEITLENCIDVFDALFNRKVVLPNVETLKLYEIKCEKIWHNQLGGTSVQNLTHLIGKRCHKLKYIFSSLMVSNLVQLQHLEISNCDLLEEIVAKERGEESTIKFVFPRVTFLHLKNLQKLRAFYTGMHTSMVQQKRDESTTSRQSNEITMEVDVFDTLFNGKIVLPNLETLELYEIKCEKIWHNQLGGTSCCVQNLTRLIVKRCHKLKYIFSSSMVSNLVQLQHLEVSNCDLLEEIVAKESGEESAIKFVFPRVTFLHLKNLQKLRAFYLGIHFLEWPVLKSLEIDSFESIQKIFISDIHSFQDSNKEGQSDIQAPQHVFLVEKVFPKLKELEIIGEGITMKWQGQFPEKLFHKLKFVEMLHDKSTVLPLCLLPRLEKLKLKRSSYKEIFSYEQVDEHDLVILAQLKYLELFGLNYQKHLWKEGLNFQNLTTLNVDCCDGLLSLVTPSIAKTLCRLQTMSIYSCKMMTEIVANEEGAAKDEIVFNKLKKLHLNGLNSLTSFCSGNCTFNFSSLEVLYLSDCPKMKIFSNGVLNTPKLQTMHLNGEECRVGDLNTTIQYFNKGQTGEPSTQHQE